jgi:FAD synthase
LELEEKKNLKLVPLCHPPPIKKIMQTHGLSSIGQATGAVALVGMLLVRSWMKKRQLAELAIRCQPLIHLIGDVKMGFGRGSSQLGFPTANLDVKKLIEQGRLQESTVGVYLGWAVSFLLLPLYHSTFGNTSFLTSSQN